LLENTIVFFFSDHGQRLTRYKQFLYEGGIHVPFAMSYPGTIPAGGTYNNPVVSLDFAPTFIELAGGEIKEESQFDGVNLLPHILNQTDAIPHEELIWRFTISASIREGDWKLIRLPDRLPLLYNLGTDISEQDNVAMKNLPKTEELLKKLGDWELQQPHPVFLEGAVWRRRQVDLYDKEYQLVQPESK
jgi:arylsulfatase A-like enzyme